jgi:abequosyltransferase
MLPPLVSYVIPTYNRCRLLNKCIESLILSIQASSSPESFEIVVSNNCSTDATRKVLDDWNRRCPNIIRIYHQHLPLHPSENLRFVLSQSIGCFIKPLNDKIIANINTSRCILDIVNSLYREKQLIPVIFSNGHSHQEASWQILDSFDESISIASYIITWYGSLGIWRCELELNNAFECACSEFLPQVDFLLEALARSGACCLCDQPLFGVIPTRSTDYNVAKVFGRDYSRSFVKYVRQGILSWDIYSAEMQSVFKNHILPGYFDPNGNHDYARDGYFEHLGHLQSILDVKSQTSSYLRSYLFG